MITSPLRIFIAAPRRPKLLAMKTLLLSLIVFISLPSWSFEGATPFQTKILNAQALCPHLDCPGLSVNVVELTISERQQVKDLFHEGLKSLVVGLVEDLWPDTILEGPYEIAHQVRIDHIQKVLVDQKMAGFRMTYSDKAWNLNNCQYDPKVPSTLSTCQEGRIVEAAFVSADLKEIFRDDQSFATYVKAVSQ